MIMVNTMNYLSKNIITNKRVILRCDFNVPVNNGKVVDDSKIIKSLKTINCLLDNNNKVIILSHFGRIKTEEDKKNNSLYPIYEYLKDKLEIEFIPNPLDLSIINNSGNNCFLVENTRFTDYPEKKESANDLELAKYWSSFADVFILDAFASLHRTHSSTAGLSKYLPTYLGFLVENELNNLKPLVISPPHPFVVIMGGAKVDDKIKIIDSIVTKCDKLILTGGILNTFLYVSGKKIGKSLISDDEEILNNVKSILDNYENKIYFTNSFIVNRNGVKAITIDEIEDNDIIYDNVVNINDLIDDAKIVFMNGTSGKYEIDDYEKGTKKLLKDLSNFNNVYIGGGDTVSAVNKYNMSDKFKYLSSGGGATLEYVAFGNLEALEWIKNNNNI